MSGPSFPASAKKPVALTPKERVVLEVVGLLGDGAELYGLDIVDRSNDMLGRGSVYVTLFQMEKKDLISSREVTASHPAALPRRLYSATAHGKASLAALLDDLKVSR